MKMRMDDYMAVLLARADVRDNEAALACCDLFLNCAEIIDQPHFIELSQPDNDDIVFLPKPVSIAELDEAIQDMNNWMMENMK